METKLPMNFLMEYMEQQAYGFREYTTPSLPCYGAMVDATQGTDDSFSNRSNYSKTNCM
jgi:hypothetical protein